MFVHMCGHMYSCMFLTVRMWKVGCKYVLCVCACFCLYECELFCLCVSVCMFVCV